MLEPNESFLDRALRVIVGIVLLSFIVVGPRTLWGVLGVVPLVTGLMGFCPLYRLLGLNTCSVGRSSQAGGAS